MYLQYQNLMSAAFEVKPGIKKESLFFSNDEFFYYTRAISFRKIFQELVLTLDIINPKALQTQMAVWRNKEQERNKITTMEKAIQMGEMLLIKNKKKLFAAKRSPNQNLGRFFHISCDSKDLFFKEIMLPLLRLVQASDDNKWEWIESKQGFWRDLTDTESVPVGSEVSLNLTTGRKMLKL